MAIASINRRREVSQNVGTCSESEIEGKLPRPQRIRQHRTLPCRERELPRMRKEPRF